MQVLDSIITECEVHTYTHTHTHTHKYMTCMQVLDSIITECEVQKSRLQHQQESGHAALASPEALKDWALTTPHNPSGYVCIFACAYVYMCNTHTKVYLYVRLCMHECLV